MAPSNKALQPVSELKPQSDVKPPGAGQLVLGIFSGVGLLDMAFQETGFCVCAAPELITGGDIRRFHSVPGRINGVIGGPPCQGFSSLNRHWRNPEHPSVINSRQMLTEACRIIDETQPEWWLIENVLDVPDVRIDGYPPPQRMIISDWECGGVQSRSRCIQFGHRLGFILRPQRVNTLTRKQNGKMASLTTKARSQYQFYPDHCRIQGLETPLDLPGWTVSAKKKAIGNGVPLPMGRALANAVANAAPREPNIDCACDCGRLVSVLAKTATPTCRKRISDWNGVRRPFCDLEGFHDE